MTEAELQASILEYIQYLTPKVLVYHTYDSRRSHRGFPDLVIVGRRGMLFRELKSAKGRVTSDQHDWLLRLGGIGENAAIWRPEDWPDRVVHEIGEIR